MSGWPEGETAIMPVSKERLLGLVMVEKALRQLFDGGIVFGIVLITAQEALAFSGLVVRGRGREPNGNFLVEGSRR